MKAIHRSRCCSRAFSWICRAANSISVVPRFFLNLHWDSGHTSSTTNLLRRERITRARTFPATDSSEIPLLFPHMARSPLFLYSEIILEFFHSWGTSPASHIISISSWSLLRVTGPPCFSNSPGIASAPGLLLFLRFLMGLLISCRVGGSDRTDLVGICGIFSMQLV